MFEIIIKFVESMDSEKQLYEIYVMIQISFDHFLCWWSGEESSIELIPAALGTNVLYNKVCILWA